MEWGTGYGLENVREKFQTSQTRSLGFDGCDDGLHSKQKQRRENPPFFFTRDPFLPRGTLYTVVFFPCRPRQGQHANILRAENAANLTFKRDRRDQRATYRIGVSSIIQ